MDPGTVCRTRRGDVPRYLQRIASVLACLAGVLAYVAPCAAERPSDEALERALGTLLSTTPGETATQLAAAWKVVADADYSQLPRIFQAADKANPIAANWLSMALDRIVQQSTAKGQQLPVNLLQNVAIDASRAPLARKMSMDLLARADRKYVEALQPLLINDPEAAFRRPAVEQAMEEARQLAESDKPNQERIAAWRRLLESARDEDQVVQIARELKTLGHEVDLATQFGYLIDWYVIGPFDNSEGRGFDLTSPPEELTLKGYEDLEAGVSAGEIQGKSGPVSWKKVQAARNNGDVNLNEAIEKLRDVMAYGATVFVSQRSQQVDVRLRIQNSFKIWLNGQLLMEQPVGHTGNSFDQYKVRANLRPGKNFFVVKSCQVESGRSMDFYDNWHFCVRVCDTTGAAILSADHAAVTGEGDTQDVEEATLPENTEGGNVQEPATGSKGGER